MSTPEQGAEGETEGPVVRDKRRIDPETGAVRDVPGDGVPSAGGVTSPAEGAVSAAETLAAERLNDLQRLQAEYVNYRKRVERDRDVARLSAVSDVLDALIPVMDDIELARQHGELADGPFAAIAEKLETTLARFGWERYGAVGEEFDPNVHEALMHDHQPEAETTVVTQVMQPGYRAGERILRAARVAVVGP